MSDNGNSEESPIGKVRELLASLPTSSPLKGALAKLSGEAGLGVVLGAPIAGSVQIIAQSIGGVLADWLGNRAQREFSVRIEEILWRLADEVERVQLISQPLLLDDEWAELVLTTLPLAARAKTEEKRALFAALLATASREDHATSRDDARVYASILDQLEFEHVQVLRTLMELSREITWHQFWGHKRAINFTRTDLPRPLDGALVLRLDALGLVSLSATTSMVNGEEVFHAEGRDLGVGLLHWVQSAVRE